MKYGTEQKDEEDEGSRDIAQFIFAPPEKKWQLFFKQIKKAIHFSPSLLISVKSGNTKKKVNLLGRMLTCPVFIYKVGHKFSFSDTNTEDRGAEEKVKENIKSTDSSCHTDATMLS